MKNKKSEIIAILVVIILIIATVLLYLFKDKIFASNKLNNNVVENNVTEVVDEEAEEEISLNEAMGYFNKITYKYACNLAYDFSDIEKDKITFNDLPNEYKFIILYNYIENKDDKIIIDGNNIIIDKKYIEETKEKYYNDAEFTLNGSNKSDNLEYIIDGNDIIIDYNKECNSLRTYYIYSVEIHDKKSFVLNTATYYFYKMDSNINIYPTLNSYNYYTNYEDIDNHLNEFTKYSFHFKYYNGVYIFDYVEKAL